jgi:hypothetical protein
MKLQTVLRTRVKKIRIIFFLLPAFLFTAKAASSQPAISPEQTVISFYEWYLKWDNKPQNDTATLSRYVTKWRLRKNSEFMHSGVDGDPPVLTAKDSAFFEPEDEDADYFTKTQDVMDDDWKQVYLTQPIVKNGTATAILTFGSLPDQQNLDITLKLENGI